MDDYEERMVGSPAFSKTPASRNKEFRLIPDN